MELFQGMLTHDADGWARAIESIEQAPDQGSVDVRRARAIAFHGLAARRLWLSRLDPGTRPPAGLFVEDSAFGELDAELDAMARAWAGFAEGLTEARLGARVEHGSTQAGQWSTRLCDIIAHVCQHGAYHRGQIAMLVKRVGGEPASTDYIFAVRARAEQG